ncbi:MAG: HAD family hydrolase [Oligoflexia bacterium]|nr:HAD family hydrolase [Oligoflexia bacterium]
MLVCSGAPARAAAPLDIVLDLDWTLVYEIFDDRQLTGATQDVFEISGRRYVFADGAGEFIQRLLALPGARVSFFSGGEEGRNRAVLERLRLPDGRTAMSIAHRVLSRDALVAVPGAAETAPFTDRFKKDLGRALPEADLSRLIWLDDQKGFGLPEQQRNLLLLEPTYDYLAHYQRGREQVRQGLKLRYLPPSRELWALEREKLARALGLIEEAVARSEQSGRPVVEVLRSLQFDGQGLRINPLGPEQRRFFTTGRERLRFPEPCPAGFRKLVSDGELGFSSR